MRGSLGAVGSDEFKEAVGRIVGEEVPDRDGDGDEQERGVAVESLLGLNEQVQKATLQPFGARYFICDGATTGDAGTGRTGFDSKNNGMKSPIRGLSESRNLRGRCVLA